MTPESNRTSSAPNPPRGKSAVALTVGQNGSVDEVEIYQSADGTVTLDVKTDGDTVWLTQAQLAELFQSSKANISEHIKNVFDEGELSPEATVRKSRTVRTEGVRPVARTVQHYNLDLILSLGYRVKSNVATQFRIWANGVLKRYIVEGVATNEARLREIGAMVQLLERSSDDTVAGNLIAR
jgi:hypothetical protein